MLETFAGVLIALLGTAAPAVAEPPPNMAITIDSSDAQSFTIVVTSAEAKDLPVTVRVVPPRDLDYVSGTPAALELGSDLVWNETLPANKTLKLAFQGSTKSATALNDATLACAYQGDETHPVVCASFIR